MTDKSKPRHDHERTDWNLKWVITSFVILVIAVSTLIAGSWWVFRNFQFAAASRQMGTVRGTENVPPEPRLQVSPERDWLDMLSREQHNLNSYGWIDRNHGLVHIPIERAMALVAQRGLPAGVKGGNGK